jgi:hypothetical protein
MRPKTEFLYLTSVPDGRPDQATPLQGFAPSLCDHYWIVSNLIDLPSDLTELANDDHDLVAARRMSGEGPIHWVPVSPASIIKGKLGAREPFVVLFVSPADAAAQYSEWNKSNEAPALIVAEAGGDISYSDFSVERMYAHFLSNCDKVGSAWGQPTLQSIKSILQNPAKAEARDIGYTIGGHNAFSPNLSALMAAGFNNPVDKRFDRVGEGNSPYIEGIVRTTNSVLDERDRIGARELHRLYPIKPDLMLFAPSMFADLHRLAGDTKGQDNDLKVLERGLKILQTQSGYAFQTTGDQLFAAGVQITGEGIIPNPIISARQKELFFNTALADIVGASEISAVIRLPNEVNRTAGQVKQFSLQRRSRESRDRKRVKAFKDVQARLRQAVPKEFFDLIRRSKSGIRIVSDAPLEWLDIDGLPLCLAKDTTRIPTTPGNTFVSLMKPQPVARLRPEVFREILIINSVKEDDPIYPFFVIAMNTYATALKGKVTLRQVEVGSRKDFVDAINSFDGALMIFNGHGGHDADEAAILWLKDEPVDVWGLEGELRRVPPIVVLSACDTQAVDRNHATSALGFLSLGAATVLGSFFPLPALEASIFAARLIMRVVEFIPAAIANFHRAIPWTEVTGGMLRMTLLHDFLLRIENGKLASKEQVRSINEKGTAWINLGSDQPFEKIIQALIELGIPESQVRSELRSAIASSIAINIVQLGRPENIIFDTEDRIRAQAELLREYVVAE